MTIQDKISLGESKGTEKKECIHAYFGMLHHFVHRNKSKVKELKLAGKKLEQTELSIAKPLTLR